MDENERKISDMERLLCSNLQHELEEITNIIHETPAADAQARLGLTGKIDQCIDACARAEFAKLLIKFVILRKDMER